ncbi:MAG: hypothetical protein ACXV8U_23505 [Methylobacter sp.]
MIWNRDSFWSFHWYEHHAVCTKNAMLDPDYLCVTLSWSAQTKELLVALGAVLLHIPLPILFSFLPAQCTYLGYFIATSIAKPTLTQPGLNSICTDITITILATAPQTGVLLGRGSTI